MDQMIKPDEMTGITVISQIGRRYLDKTKAQQCSEIAKEDRAAYCL